MEAITLKAEKREVLGKKVRHLRSNNLLPAVLYGRKVKPVSLAVDRKSLIALTREAGESTIINIEIAGEKPVNALIRDVQRQPVTDEIIHVDFYQVDMSTEIQTQIPLEFVGVAPAVEELEGNLITNKDSIEVECLPNKLVSEIKIDVSGLKTFEDLIHVKDIAVPEGIKVLDDPEEVIVLVTPPRSEEELAEMEAETAAETEKAQIDNIEAEAEAQKAEEGAESEGAEQTEQAPPENKEEKKQE